MEQIRITSRTLIGGYMREEGEVLSVYPWQARRLRDAEQAEAADQSSDESEDEMSEAYGEDLALTLKGAGYESVEAVEAADGDELLAVNGIGRATLRKIRGE